MNSRTSGTKWLARTLALATCAWSLGGCGPAPADVEGSDLETGALQSGISSASGTIGGKLAWVHFNHPPAGGTDVTITNEIKRLIDHTPAGGTIRAAIHSISNQAVADSLLAAQNRGVTVYVVMDAKNATTGYAAVTTIKKLANYKFCTNASGGGGCISTSASSNMHTKLFTFSQTTDPSGVSRPYVSWVGSANLTGASGTEASNNSVTLYDAVTLYDSLNANFTDMWNRKHYTGNDYYDSATGRGYYLTTPVDAYASPEGAGQTDTIVTRLNDVTPDSTCRVRIGMAFVTEGRPDLLAQIKRMRAGGCAVWMVVSGDASAGIDMPQSVYNELLDAGVSLRRKDKVHDKFFVVYGNYGSTYNYRVYTGSQNWSQDALNENEELFLKLAPETGSVHPIYDAYYAHFNDAYNIGVTCTKSNYPCK